MLKIQSRFQVEDECINLKEKRNVGFFFLFFLGSARKLSLNCEKYHQNELLQSDASIEFCQFAFGVHGIRSDKKTDYAFHANFITKSHV